jgi:hypothetical protein
MLVFEYRRRRSSKTRDTKAQSEATADWRGACRGGAV